MGLDVSIHKLRQMSQKDSSTQEQYLRKIKSAQLDKEKLKAILSDVNFIIRCTTSTRVNESFFQKLTEILNEKKEKFQEPMQEFLRKIRSDQESLQEEQAKLKKLQLQWGQLTAKIHGFINSEEQKRGQSKKYPQNSQTFEKLNGQADQDQKEYLKLSQSRELLNTKICQLRKQVLQKIISISELKIRYINIERSRSMSKKTPVPKKQLKINEHMSLSRQTFLQKYGKSQQHQGPSQNQLPSQRVKQSTLTFLRQQQQQTLLSPTCAQFPNSKHIKSD